MHWTLSLSDPWFDHVKNGTKKYEGRLYRGLPRYMKIGDLITFYPDDGESLEKSITCQIMSIHKFPSFKQSLEKLPINEVLPNVPTVDEGVEIYKKYASIESQNKFGVCQIEIKNV